MADDYKIYIRRKSDGKALLPVDIFKKFEAIPRFNDVGAWVLELSATSRAASISTWGSGVLVTKNGQPYFSGVLRNFIRDWNAGQDTLVLSGLDDNYLLDTRCVHPSPVDGDFATQSHDVRTGAGETVIKEYVSFNIGPDALITRRDPLVAEIEPDQERGSNTTERGRMQYLLEFIQRVAIKTGGLGFKIVDGEFMVYVPRDLTNKIIFTPDLGNIRSFAYSGEAPQGNYIYVGGQGELTSRVFVEGGDNESILRHGRIEKFRDRRDTGDIAELMLTRYEELVLNGEKSSIRFDPMNIEGIQYGRDYDLGDVVTAIIDRVRVSAVIRETPISLTKDSGLRIAPSISTPGDSRVDEIIRLYDKVRTLEQRVQNLEIV